MAGIRITDLPVVTEVLDSDQLLVARGETTRKAFGTALVTKQYAAELLSLVRELSAGTLIPSNSIESNVYLSYDPLTKQLSAELAGIIPQLFGGTGFNNYLPNEFLIANSLGNLEKFQLVSGRGIQLSATSDKAFYVINTEPHIPTNLSASYPASAINIFSSTGLSAALVSATLSSAGVMSALDKTNLTNLLLYREIVPLEFTNNITINNTLSSNLIVLNSPNTTTITLPSAVSSASSQFTFVRAGSGHVQFVPDSGVTVFSTVNSTYRRISCINGSATAYFKKTNEWHLVGDLESTWDKKLTGPDSVDKEQKVGIHTIGSFDTLYYKNDWDITNTNFVSMVIQVSGTNRSVIDFTSDRIGAQFGYNLGPGLGGFKTCDEGPKYFGLFSEGVVNLT